MEKRMYNRVLNGIDSERKSSAQTIAQYQARIAATKQEVLDRSYEPIFNVQNLNDEVTDMFRRFKEKTTRTPKATSQVPSLDQSLYGFHTLVVNASSNQQVSIVPLFYDFAELVRETGMSTSITMPTTGIQVPLTEAMEAFSELKRTLLISCAATSGMAVDAQLQGDHWEITVHLNNVQEELPPIEVTDPKNPLSFEFTRSTSSTLVIKFRLSNIGT